MTQAIRFRLAAAALASSINLAAAQTAQDHDSHHPGSPGATQTSPPAAQHAPAPGPGMMMGGDMSQMMKMMNMMSMMRDGMMPMGMGRGMQPLRHVEGLIAFQKAELKITDEQLPQWNAFADAVRGSASRLQKAMTDTASATDIVPAPQQMERRIALLSARLEAMQTVLAAGKSLYAVLSEEQKHTADELVAEHMMAMRGMGRMPGR